MSIFYIYELWDPIKVEPFYVGKGKDSKRSKRYLEHIKRAMGLKQFKDNNKHKLNRIRKIILTGFKPEIRIVFKTCDESEAFEKEKELISFYGRRDKKTGSLTNLTDGGDGCSGRHFSEEERKKIALRVRGKGNPMYGKKHTLKALQDMSKAAKARPGTPHKEEWKQHLRENNAGGKAISKPIYQIDFLGKIINKWPSGKKAAEELKYPTYSNISSCAHYKYRTYQGFYWLFEKDTQIKNDHLVNIKELNKRRTQISTAKKIKQYSLNGVLLKIWDSQLDIKRELGLSNKIISDIIRGKRQKRQNIYGGYKWENASSLVI